jgi:hypothetical protein
MLVTTILALFVLLNLILALVPVPGLAGENC